MKARFVPLALIATLLLTVGALAAACGGEESLTLEEYFQQLEALTATAEDRFVEIEEASGAELDAATSEEERFAAIENLFTNTQPIFTTFADGLNDLKPPAVVEELHNEFVDVYDEVVVYFEETLNRFGDLDSIADREGLFVGERLDEACTTLQDIADENEIDVDLDCDDSA